MSVAASAYKALFAGPPVTAQVSVCFIFLKSKSLVKTVHLPGLRESHIIVESMSFKLSFLLIGGYCFTVYVGSIKAENQP